MERKEAILKIGRKEREKLEGNTKPVSSYFGKNTFNEKVMRKKLPKSIYEKFKKCIEGEEELTLEIADAVAHAMKEWAIENGATHYTHWFQPLTGSTAEKHDSFLSLENGKPIERFSGKQLIKQEPDASSFPSGGLRATFEARGYTAWDPTSPAFLMESDTGKKTLCIPSVFISYHGEALDKKTPLLRSNQVLAEKVKSLLKLFGLEVKKVVSTAGPELEYFLLDRGLALLRPDLMITGRTLFGAKPPKGQELEDQYFGSIKDRMLAFMNDVEEELYKLGVPIKTRHNEVAPHQYEITPIFEESNLATDHNQLVMEILRKKAIKHYLFLTLHEKPFARINGSGKHLNWSISADGMNLLDPGHNPAENFQFLAILIAVVRAIYKYAPLLRASVAYAGNDHRLGGNEAPPAIISVFLGTELTKLLETIEKGKTPKKIVSDLLHTGVGFIPKIPKDNTDRNRTSPFAFTGNKFEFRAVGASQSIAIPLTVLNTIVAESIEYIVNEIEKLLSKGKELYEAVITVVKKIIPEIKPVLFEGDNYSPEWYKEAKKRNLPNLKTAPEALKEFVSRKSIKLFTKYGILTEDEIRARYHVELGKYIKIRHIEAELALELSKTRILPAVFKYQSQLAEQVATMSEIYKENKVLLNGPSSVLKEYSEKVNILCEKINKLENALKKASEIEDLQSQAEAYCEKVLSAMEELREIVDDLELCTDDSLWVLPKYYELLFYA